ncbi:coiled-coil domain-containing protein [Rhodopirellula sallentina]|uniref:Uncharacterized protein n=1 Tax=Rhodopirellula sallentina SM41 TaxID=1263870 RepID=M5U2V3_9BACT|nr:hypothetical protein [Rhodopirellula sallentina]EMI55609.1 hypothetical protein RSSM_02970 [Rhodopirellula sallentina SM41]
MPHTAQDFFRQIDDEIASAGRLIETIRQSNRAAAHRINALIEKRTDAFVRLAKHYLPVLTLKTLADAWHEVHGEIRQIMLAQSDTCRQLQRELTLQDARCHEIETELHETTERFEKARRDLLSKTGSFHKHLREDPEIARLSAEITRVDREIQIGIDSLESVNDEAQKKLPDYEECELFRYLREQKYGTTEYRQRGLERRWDRWIARLINFDEANESFEYLTEAPSAIQELIREKQERYKQLLRALESARNAAADRYGIEEQTRLCDRLGDEVESLEQQHTEAMWDRSILESDLQEAEDINGEHYQKALAIYTEFLKSTQPETLAVYAACTESQVDDEICARIRSLQSEIENEQAESVAHAERIVELRKYRTGLNELSRLLRNHLRHSSSEVRTRDDFRFDIVLNDMRDLHLSPMKTWRRLLAAISDPIRSVPLPGRFTAEASSPHAGAFGPVEAAFLAASENSPGVLGGRPCDPTGVLIRPEREPRETGRQSMFDTLAICRSESESKHIVSLLQEHGIRCFAHNHLLDLPAVSGDAPTSEWQESSWEDHAQQRLVGVAVEHAADCSQTVPQIDAVDFSSVVVEVARFHEARHHLLSHLRLHDTEWDCPACDSHVDRGYYHCWRCGQTAPHT